MPIRFDQAHYDRKLNALKAQREKDATVVERAAADVTGPSERAFAQVLRADSDYQGAMRDFEFDQEKVHLCSNSVSNAELAVKQAQNALDEARRLLDIATHQLDRSRTSQGKAYLALEKARAAHEAASAPQKAYLAEARRRLEKTDRRIANHEATRPRTAMDRALDDEGGIGRLEAVQP